MTLTSNLRAEVDRGVDTLEFQDSKVSLDWETGLAYNEAGLQVARFVGTYDSGWDFHKPLPPLTAEMVEHRKEFIAKEARLLRNQVSDLLREISRLEAGINSDARPRNAAAELADEVYTLERKGVIPQGDGPIPQEGVIFVIPEGPGGGEKWFPLDPLHSEVWDHRGHCKLSGYRLKDGVAAPFPKHGARAWAQAYQFSPSNDD